MTKVPDVIPIPPKVVGIVDRVSNINTGVRTGGGPVNLARGGDMRTPTNPNSKGDAA